MKVGAYCRRGVISISSNVDIVAATELMREQHVGFLVAYKLGDDIRRPIGVLTDRDIVLRRMPVVDGRGALGGMIAIDDVLEVVTTLMCDITGSIKSEQRHEWRARMT